MTISNIDEDQNETWFKINEKCIPKIRLIGLHCEIEYINIKFKGSIISETKNTITINTSKGWKTVPKEQSEIIIYYHNKKFTINLFKLDIYKSIS